MPQTNPSTFRRLPPIVAGVVAVVCASVGTAHAALLPHRSVQQMCFEADLIITGTHLGMGRVQVDEVLFRAPRPDDDGDNPDKLPRHINVPALPHLEHNVGAMGDRPGAPLKTQQAFLFLTRDDEGDYIPVAVARNGASGVVWFDLDACYFYGQVFSPGPYLLQPTAAKRESRVPHGKDAMVKEIKLGLEQRKQWEAIQAIEDLEKRASKLATYLLPRTAPQGNKRAADLRKAIRAIGPKAVPAVVDVIKNRHEADNLDTAVLILYDIARRHPGSIEAAVPTLCDLLERPGNTHVYYALTPLTAAADKRAVPFIKPLLEHPSEQVRGQAVEALEAIAKRSEAAANE